MKMKPLVPSQSPPCVSRAGFADMLDVSVRTVDRMIAANEIPVHRVRGKVVRILRSDAERYLNGEKLKVETLKVEILPACIGHTSSGLRPPSPQSGEGKKNLKTNNQTGATAPESNRTNQPKH